MEPGAVAGRYGAGGKELDGLGAEVEGVYELGGREGAGERGEAAVLLGPKEVRWAARTCEKACAGVAGRVDLSGSGEGAGAKQDAIVVGELEEDLGGVWGGEGDLIAVMPASRSAWATARESDNPTSISADRHHRSSCAHEGLGLHLKRSLFFVTAQIMKGQGVTRLVYIPNDRVVSSMDPSDRERHYP